MCLIILKNNEKPIELEKLRRGFLRNPDSSGFSIPYETGILTKKGFTTFDSFMKAYKQFEYGPALIHFRYSTCQGTLNEANAHPFKFGHGKYVVAHNGIINIPREKNKSDTAQFVKDILNPLEKIYKWGNPLLVDLLSRYVGPENKLVLMDKTGVAIIINGHLGVWEDGNWYSNKDYKTIPPIKRTYRKLRGKIRRASWGQIFSGAVFK